MVLQIQFYKFPFLYLGFIYFRFDGRVVARLPFLPISWIQGLSHRNLPGDDYTECSFIFLYILCTMSIRQVGEVDTVNVGSRLSARFHEAVINCVCIYLAYYFNPCEFE